MFATKKVRLFGKSDIYRRLVARRLLKDIPRYAQNTWRNFDPDDVLRYAGLSTYKPVRAGFGGVGLFVFGAICGGVAAMLLSPKAGPEIRTTVKDKAMGYLQKQNIGIGTEKQASA